MYFKIIRTIKNRKINKNNKGDWINKLIKNILKQEINNLNNYYNRSNVKMI